MPARRWKCGESFESGACACDMFCSPQSQCQCRRSLSHISCALLWAKSRAAIEGISSPAGADRRGAQPEGRVATALNTQPGRQDNVTHLSWNGFPALSSLSLPPHGVDGWYPSSFSSSSALGFPRQTCSIFYDTGAEEQGTIEVEG